MGASRRPGPRCPHQRRPCRRQQRRRRSEGGGCRCHRSIERGRDDFRRRRRNDDDDANDDFASMVSFTTLGGAYALVKTVD